MDKIVDLAGRMRAKRESGSHPYVLVIGAGASVASGTHLNRAVVERVVGSYDLQAFDAYLMECSDDERFAILRDLVEGTSPSGGYAALAELIRAGYFDVVLSTNFDPLLEDALAGLPMRRRDYVTLVHGVMTPEFIADHLDNRTPRVKVLKLHGDLFYRKFYYTGAEITTFPLQIGEALRTYLNRRDVLIVGHGMRDEDVNRCLSSEGSALWYVSPAPPPAEIAALMASRRSQQNVIDGDDGTFDAFFTRLAAVLLVDTATVSVDRISQAIYVVARVDGPSVGSGFLLGSTGLLVTDSSILAGLGQDFGLGVEAEVHAFSGGPHRRAELVLAPQTALDYAVFRIVGVGEVSPLRLAGELPTVGEPVTACISLGDTQGFHDGTVTGVNRSIPIRLGPDRKETISDLIETDIKVAPGACGSPLVRRDGRVVGVLVAGNGRSYALTAPRLEDMLARAGVRV